MALTAFPTLTFNAGSGTDSAASGAGPGTALTGTANASTSGASTTVSLGGSPDLSGVATDGSHVLWLKGYGFYRISTTDNGADTVVIETAVNISTACDWAIGGKRATLDETESRKLFAATVAGVAADSGTGGAAGRWIISLEDDQTITSAITAAFTAGTGALTIQMDSSTRRTITQSGNAALFACNTANKMSFDGIVFRHSNATKSAAFLTTAAVSVKLRNCIVGDSGGTDCPLSCMAWSSGATPVCVLENCSVLRCTSHGFTTLVVVRAYGSEISRCGGAGISTTSGGDCTLIHCIISHNTSYGVNTAGSNITAHHCTIHGNGNTGLRAASGAPLIQALNNQFTANATGHGLAVVSSLVYGSIIEYNNFGNASDSTNNASGTASLASGDSLSSTNLTTAPAYTDASSGTRNFAVGTAMKEVGFPASTATIGAGQSGSTSYVDIGAVQRQEAAGSGGGRGSIIGG